LHKDDDSPTSLILADESETLAFAQRIAKQLKFGMVIYLHGDLGAGKTTLVRGIVQSLGYNGRVKSPTYTLVEPYQVAGLSLMHFDLYRMNDPDEWDAAGFRDDFDGHNIFLIEWPEKAADVIPPADLEIKLLILDQSREVQLKANTVLGQECAKQL